MYEEKDDGSCFLKDGNRGIKFHSVSAGKEFSILRIEKTVQHELGRWKNCVWSKGRKNPIGGL